MSYTPPLTQIAFSVIDLRLTERWFREGIGLLPAGGARQMMRGPLAANVQGLPGAASTCWWLVATNPRCQLELFQFDRPLARLMPHDFRPCDIGYTRIGLWVADFDATLRRLDALGSSPLTEPLGTRGARRACVRSPDGVYVEIMEDDPLAGLAPSTWHCPAAIRSVTLSTPDVDLSAAFFANGIGLAESAVTLHSPAHEALWGLAGAQTRSKTFLAGDVLLETVQYLDPIGKPWPEGYRISDQGILNIAFGAENKRDFATVYERCIAASAKQNCKPVHLPFLDVGVVYVNDRQRFSVELLWMTPGRASRRWGLEPLPLEQRPAPDTHRIEQSVKLDLPIEKVWAAITDHEGMSAWSGFDPVSLSRAGAPERNGYGAERTMLGPFGAMVEQVVDWNPPHRMRYRVIDGSPVICQQGELRLMPAGAGTELTWTIRFRPKVPGTGWLLRPLFNRMLTDLVHRELPRHLSSLSPGDAGAPER